MRLLGMGLTGLLLASGHVSAQGPAKFETFNATTANLAVGSGESIRINVFTWTPAAEREKIVAAFRETSAEQLAESLRSAPSAGYIWTSENLGYSVRYAHRIALPKGGERIILATDRPLGSWSRTVWKAAAADTPMPLTLIELRLNGQGKGEGKMSLAAKIIADDADKTLALDYEGAPVLLKQATRIATPGAGG
jgi:hypothetical protein